MTLKGPKKNQNFLTRSTEGKKERTKEFLTFSPEQEQEQEEEEEEEQADNKRF